MTSRFYNFLGAGILAAGVLAGAGRADELNSGDDLEVFPSSIELSVGSSHRVLATTVAEGRQVDATPKALWASEDDKVARVIVPGEVEGIGPGKTELRVTYGGKVERVAVTVTSANERISFQNQVLPVLSRAGCNAGKCHAKPNGQNGFKLSVFAYDSEGDYREIVKDGRGRRVFPAYPPESLLLKKPTLGMDHEGGRRFEKGSRSYEVLRLWIEQGMPFKIPGEASLEEIDIFPRERSYVPGQVQKMLVRARYSDGTWRDVTELAEFDSTAQAIAEVSESGELRAKGGRGEGVIVARYMGLVAISRAAILPEVLLPPEKYASLPRNNFIDELAYARFQRLGLFPSARCTDEEFIRRSSLDVLGQLPSVEQVRQFLADSSADKREKWIEHLLGDAGYADHWAGKWADLLRPNPSRVGVKSVYVLDQWLRGSFRENKRYDAFVRDVLTAQGSTHEYGPAVVFRDRREPEDMTTLVSQVFLGVRLECAKCHHHPNERWSQSDFYQFAAYFGELKRKGTGISPPISGDYEVIYHGPGGAVKHPVTGAVMKPAPLGERRMKEGDGDPRRELAEWLLAPENPYLSRAVVNRVWAELMGRGIVHPVDDFRASNPAVNEAVLEALALDFVRHGYDLKHLIRTILRSHLYQLSSVPNEHNAEDNENFARFYRKRLGAEVLLGAIGAVTETTSTFQGMAAGLPAARTWNYKLDSHFLDAFGRPNASSDCPCERDTRASVVQALHLMNSNEVQSRIAAEGGRARRLAESDRTPQEIIEDLYLAAYSRWPTASELAAAASAFERAGATRQQATEDVMWALLNSAEFVFNH